LALRTSRYLQTRALPAVPGLRSRLRGPHAAACGRREVAGALCAGDANVCRTGARRKLGARTANS